MNEILILNNCPSFYKINLYNELAKHRKIFCCFFGSFRSSSISKKDFNANFDYILLNDFQVEKRNKLKIFKNMENIQKNKTLKSHLWWLYYDRVYSLSIVY